MTGKELIDFINDVPYGKGKEIEGYDALAVNQNHYHGIAIDYLSESPVSESFSNVFLGNADIIYHDATHNMIVLYTKDEYLNEHYGTLCLDFLDTSNREVIQKNPLQWFNDWKELLGNTQKKKMVYDIIGEMKILTLLLKRGENPTWASMKKGTFDITTSKNIYEVKTTIKKTGNFVTIHSQFQMDTDGKDNLHLMFVRVEENDTGESIDDLFNQLRDAKYKDIAEVDEYLKQQGYYGNMDRLKKYRVLEIRDYPVDDKFPRISDETFVDGKFPDGVIKIEYTISLDGLSYQPVLEGVVKDA